MRKMMMTVLLVIALAPQTDAQELASICKSAGDLTVGQWVKFQSDAPVVSTLNGRIAIVDE